jgi:hypothetical protein
MDLSSLILGRSCLPLLSWRVYFGILPKYVEMRRLYDPSDCKNSSSFSAHVHDIVTDVFRYPVVKSKWCDPARGESGGCADPEGSKDEGRMKFER